MDGFTFGSPRLEKEGALFSAAGESRNCRLSADLLFQFQSLAKVRGSQLASTSFGFDAIACDLRTPVFHDLPIHSLRNAIIGSTREERHAGSAAAIMTIGNKIVTTPM